MKEVPAGAWVGNPEFLSYEKFKTWAKNHGDIFKQDEETADFTVRCQTKEFKVHKNFLSFQKHQISGPASHDSR